MKISNKLVYLTEKLSAARDIVNKASLSIKQYYDKNSPEFYANVKSKSRGAYVKLGNAKDEFLDISEGCLSNAEKFTLKYPKGAWATTAILASSLTFGGMHYLGPKQATANQNTPAIVEQKTPTPKRALQDYLVEVNNTSTDMDKVDEVTRGLKSVDYNAFTRPTRDNEGNITYQTIITSTTRLTPSKFEAGINGIIGHNGSNKKGKIVEYNPQEKEVQTPVSKSTGTENILVYGPKDPKTLEQKTETPTHKKRPKVKGFFPNKKYSQRTRSNKSVISPRIKDYQIKPIRKGDLLSNLEIQKEVTDTYNSIRDSYVAGDVNKTMSHFSNSLCDIRTGNDKKGFKKRITSSIKNYTKAERKNIFGGVTIYNDLELLELYKKGTIKCPIKPGQMGLLGPNGFFIVFEKNKNKWEAVSIDD